MGECGAVSGPQQSATRDAIAAALIARHKPLGHGLDAILADKIRREAESEADFLMRFVDAARAEGRAAALTDAARAIEALEEHAYHKPETPGTLYRGVNRGAAVMALARLGEERPA
jgi:hypothetical protein